jgi:L-ascorbate 6-phosphate lactonase
MSLARTIEETKVAPGSVMCWWLGGAGFVFKTSSGTQVYIDPYFSNCVASIFGVDRAFPPPIRAEQARPDLVISTHWHEDHLDPEGLPIVARHSQAMFMAPPSCVSRLLGWLVPRDRVSGIKSGESHQFKDVKITGVAARHVVDTPGWEANDAIGIVLEFDELRVYHSGDTEYDLRLRAMAYDKDHPIHVCIIAI